MLKKDITYTDFDGNVQTEAYYFNLSKVELAEMEFEHEGGMSAMLEAIIASGNKSQILATFKSILAKAFGVRSEDGKRFMKSPELFREFTETAAFDALVMELATNAEAAGEFIVSVVPKDMAEQMGSLETVQLPTGDTLTETLEEPDSKPWITENREPTKAELTSMSRDDLVEAMRRKNQE